MDVDVVAAELRALPPRIAQWADHLAAAAVRHNVDPIALAAILEEETHGGEACVPPGPAGSGDFSAPCPCGTTVRGRGPGIVHCGSCGAPCSMPEVGYGHGLMQIDSRTWGAWLRDNDWRDPWININKGASILADSIRYVGGHLLAGIAAYNAGPRRAISALRACAGQPEPVVIRTLDSVTFRKRYVANAVETMRVFQELIDAAKAHPEV